MAKQTIDSLGIVEWVDSHSPEGFGYKHFRYMQKRKVSVASMARVWAVTWSIMQKWIDKDEKENGKP